MSDANQAPRGTNSAVDIDYVKRIKVKYEASLLRLPHVVGVGIGLAPAASAAQERGLALVINVDAAVDRNALPAELEGVPVTVKTTGEFKAY